MSNQDAVIAKAWPFEEARKLAKKFNHNPPKKGYVLFETGYGPSGLPHIGTFGEVVRTCMVKQAFEQLSDIPTKLICFSDDLDGLRKVPSNVPNQEKLSNALNLPLTKVPDPFEKHDSFAAHNNAKLCHFLDQFGFKYDFYSSSECYHSGKFDETLLLALRKFDDIMDIMLPTLGGMNDERTQTYSPFMPISPKTGHVLQVPTLERNSDKGTIVYQEPDGEKIEIPVTGGNVKLQWKPDWAMRWAALGVDYEMAGKDLTDSVKVCRKLVKVLGGKPPEGFNYELFLDKDGHKISKSKGNGLSIEEWLKYASPESLSLYMFQKPKTAKRLHFDIIPKTVDEYHQHLNGYKIQDSLQRLNNPVWHIHNGLPPQSNMVIGFSMLLNLVSAASTADPAILWGFIQRYEPNASPDTHPDLDHAVQHAIAYYHDEILPAKSYRTATPQEKEAILDLCDALRQHTGETDGEALQTLTYDIGKKHFGEENLRSWFTTLYEVLMGQSQGPRFGGFVSLYGIDETITLIERTFEA